MPPAPRIGAEIAGYRLESVIQRGGMAVVYLADHIRLGRKVALKILAEELSDDDHFRERFLRESRLAAGINHANIIPIFDAGEWEGFLYIAMRYIEGTDLKQLINSEGRLDPDRTLNIIGHVGSALDAAHQRGLVHRDVKPGNILVVPRGEPDLLDQVYLSDFGLTKHVESHTGLTSTGQFVGTIDYIAPEQIQGKAADHRADIYSLGCVVFECLIGKPPFDRDSDVAVLWAHLNEPAPSISDRRSEIPPGVDAVIEKAMAKSPDDRYGTCRDFLISLRSELTAPTGSMSTTAAGRGLPVSAASAEVTPTIARGKDGEPLGASPSAPMPTEPEGTAPPRRFPRRRPGWVTAAVIAFLLGVGSASAFFVATRSTETKSKSAGAIPAAEVLFAYALKPHIPMAFSDRCESVKPPAGEQLPSGTDLPHPKPAGADPETFFAEAICRAPASGVTKATYYLIHNTAWTFEIWCTGARFERTRPTFQNCSPPGNSPPPCAEGEPGASLWQSDGDIGHKEQPRANGKIGGFVLCYKSGTDHFIEWTDFSTHILGIAMGPSSQDLYAWWTTRSGPSTG